jgi:hypothetical protein
MLIRDYSAPGGAIAVTAVSFVLSLVIVVPVSGQTSIASGHWNNPAIWGGGMVPGYGAAVIISAGTTVGFSTQGCAPGQCTGAAGPGFHLGSLAVFGTLTADFPVGGQGALLILFTRTLLVGPTGRISGGAGPLPSEIGGGVYIFANPIGTGPITFTNMGVIAGDPVPDPMGARST